MPISFKLIFPLLPLFVFILVILVLLLDLFFCTEIFLDVLLFEPLDLTELLKDDNPETGYSLWFTYVI